jgi:hypothetical protein
VWPWPFMMQLRNSCKKLGMCLSLWRFASSYAMPFTLDKIAPIVPFVIY